ncbi:hypothetical protein [Yimella sp. cx-51]|uniref:hypothetical protein n=1 Tax=Yimella sp. cx-51 TaxID=2770551 RepID=UPI00165D6F22|nr:hypothetical protein [Yimella sp. cx-51]MBC9957190.1 hypothetical protein [Yimella sp. cx-51]MBD2758501.1 hypothetical protein [Yimella sp. cx-573]QTH37160.1 hypothetical protein J5M86_09610 [Yimella sp. cx-51]
MSALAAFLIAIGVADLVRTIARPRALPPIAAVLAVAAVAVLAAHDSPGAGVMMLLAAAGAVTWLLLNQRPDGEVLALAVFGVTTLVLFAGGGWAGRADGLLGDWMRGSPFPAVTRADPDHLLLAFGLVLVQLATGNTIVRLVLGAIGAIKPGPAPQASDELRGGRLLGPMERLFILGLGMAGQVTAASLVIAAKGLIRFPELQAKRNERESVTGVGIDEITEYFLVGSFVSWLVALSGLAAYSLV